MRSRIHVIMILMILLLVMPNAFSQTVLQKPVAVVNLIRSEMIDADQLTEKVDAYKKAQAQAGKDTNSITDKGVLNIMINDILVLQGAERDGITISDRDLDTLVNRQRESVSSQLGKPIDDKQFGAILQNYYGLTLDEYRDKLRQNYIVDSYVKLKKGDIISTALAPTDAQITEYFKKNAAKFINPEYVEISHIFINKKGRTDSDALDLASRISRNIRYGAKSFDEQVVEYSEDEGSKFIGGKIGWLAIDDTARKNILGEEFFDAAFSLDTGEISDVVKSNAGYHIIKILDHHAPKLLTLTDTVTPGNEMTVKQYISQSLYKVNQTNAYNKAISSLIVDLRADAEITILLDQE